MKKILAGLFLMLVPISAFAAFGNVWRSSFTVTADTAKSLCSDINVGKRKGVLHSVCVGNGDAGTVKLYNAYNTAANQVTVLYSTAAAVSGCATYDIDMSSGIVYSNSQAGTSVTILYQCN